MGCFAQIRDANLFQVLRYSEFNCFKCSVNARNGKRSSALISIRGKKVCKIKFQIKTSNLCQNNLLFDLLDFNANKIVLVQ